MGRGCQLPLVRHLRASIQGHVARPRSLQTATGRGIPALCFAGQLKPSPTIQSAAFYHSSRSLSIPNASSNCSHTVSDSKTPKSPDFSNLPGARKPKTAPTRAPKQLEITKAQANDAFKHSLNLVRTHDVDCYLSILTMPKMVQPELFAIHALNVELAMIRDKVDSRGGKDTSGMYRLQFWKDALSSIYANSPTPVPRQPVAIALCAFAPLASPSFLESLVVARQQTLGDRPFATVFEVCGYGSRTAGALIQLQAEVLSRSRLSSDGEPTSSEYGEVISKAATDIGGAYAVMNLIRSTLPLMVRGVVLLPSDLLALNGLTADKVYKKKQLDDTKHVIRDMMRVAEKQLESGRERVSTLPREIRQAFTGTAAATDHLINVVKKAAFDVYSPHLQRRNPLILWTLLYRKLTGSC